MNKKVGIINFHYSKHNYGAVLQAAALSYVIENKLIEVEHINYIPKASYSSITNKLKELILTIFSKMYLIKLIYNKPLASNHNIFEDFRNKWVKVSINTYTNKKEINEANLDYSHIIVGSDQVWRISYTVENASVYFLDFCDQRVKKVSYAASFGVDKWEESHITQDVVRLLNDFDCVSVREKSGVNICKDIFDINAEHVLDPTLLAGRSFFDKIILSNLNNIITKDNIVYYKLDVNDEFKKEVKIISNKFYCKSEDIYYKSVFYGYKYNRVDEWLLKISKAKLVITDSFHCICLSILFNKEFICISNQVRGNSRLDSLFNQLGISGRVYDEDSNQSLSDFVSNLNPINYELVNHKLDDLRVESMNFLVQSLK